MTYNGLYGILPRQYLAAELIERVSVIRGTNAFLNGAPIGVSGSLGGAIDAIPKRAGKENITQVSLGMRANQHHYAAADLGMRSDTGHFGIRFNGVHSEGDTALDKESRKLEMATLGMDYRGESLRISADLGHQDHLMDAAQPSITIAGNLDIPSAPDADSNIAQPWTFSDSHDLFGTLRAEYEFNDDITGWIAAGSRDSKEESSLSAFLTVNNAEGDFSANRFDVTHKDAVSTGELGLRVKTNTGNIQHRLTFSASAYQNHSRNAYIIFNPFTDNIYQPTELAPPTTTQFIGGDPGNPLITNTTETNSIAIADELRLLDEKLLLTLGIRQQNFREYNYDYNTGDKLSSYDESRATPLAAGVYKLSQTYSLYMNYAEGLLKGDLAPQLSNGMAVINAGEALKPYQIQQIEGGVKVDGSRLGASLGLFEIRKPLAGVNSENTFTTTGHQSNTGLEASVYGQALHSLKILGGINLIDTDIHDKHALGTPELQANLDMEWDIPGISGLSLNGHLMYTGEQYANAENTQRVPSWYRFDLGLRYLKKLPNSTTLTLRANVENATGEDYWSSVGGFPNSNYLTLGAPRTFHLVASLSF
jgi:iron complex outermembrane receptor protein